MLLNLYVLLNLYERLYVLFYVLQNWYVHSSVLPILCGRSYVPLYVCFYVLPNMYVPVYVQEEDKMYHNTNLTNTTDAILPGFG